MEALVGTSLDEIRSLADQLDVVVDDFMSLMDSHKKHVAESATCFLEMLDNMMTLLGALK